MSKPRVNLLKDTSFLTEEERKEFIEDQIAKGKLSTIYNQEQLERAYREKQIADYYGNAYSDMINMSSEKYLTAPQRAEKYTRDAYLDALAERGFIKNIDNYSYFNSLTIEGLEDFYNSNILSEDEFKEKEAQFDKLRESNPENHKKGSLFQQIFLPGADRDPDDPVFSSSKLLDAIRSSRGGIFTDEATDKRVARGEEVAKLKLEDIRKGYVNYGIDDDIIDRQINTLYSNQQEALQQFQHREDIRLYESDEDINTLKGLYSDQLEEGLKQGQISGDTVDESFSKLFDNDVRGDGAGSRYYTGYKNRNELSKFSLNDKMELLVAFQAISAKYGVAKAMQICDALMYEKVRENQGFIDRRINVLNGIGAKAAAMTYNEIAGGFVDLAYATFADAETYKKFKSGDTKAWFFNPNYWNYVDQFGVWDPNEIQRIRQNHGIGGRQNLYSMDGKFTVEQFIDESFKIVGYMLPAAALTFATRKLPVTSTWAKIIPWWEIGGSAAALGSAYSSGVYDSITFDLDSKLNSKFDNEAGDFIEQYYKERPDYIEHSLANQGLSWNDNFLLTAPAVQKAQRDLYQEAKEEYFNQNPNKKKEYDEYAKIIMQAAAHGARVDNYIETARMCVSGALWGRWMKSKLTRNALSSSRNPVSVSLEKGAKDITKRSAERTKAAAMTILSGGVDNGLDDVTAGIGKKLGLNAHNNYTGTLYGAEPTLEGYKASGDMLSGIISGIEGATEALYDPQTWIDTGIGAAGGIFGIRPNVLTLINDVVNSEGAFAEKSKKATKEAKEEWANMTKLQHINRYVSNGVTTAIADADERAANTQKYIKHFNKAILPGFKQDIQQLGNILNEAFTLEGLADALVTQDEDPTMALKDVKQITMLKSGIRIREALKDPELSQIPAVTEFADKLKRAKEGNFTEAEISDFLNDPANVAIKNSLDNEGNSNSKEIAVATMKKNAENFLKIADIYDKVLDGVKKNSDFKNLSYEVQTHIAVQIALDEIWKNRENSMEQKLSGKTFNFIDKFKKKDQPFSKTKFEFSNSVEAEYGSLKGRDDAIQAQERYLAVAKMKFIAFQELLETKKEKLRKATTEDEKLAAEKEISDVAIVSEYHRETAIEAENILDELRKIKNSVFNEDGFARTLSKEEIMQLSPKQRAKILNKEFEHNYSKEQQKIVEELRQELKDYVDADGNHVDLLQMVMDSGTMQERIENSQKSIEEVSKNPMLLNHYIERVKQRQSFALQSAAYAKAKQEQLDVLATVKTKEEAIDVVIRGVRSTNTLDRGFFIEPEVLEEFIKNNPKSKEIFSAARKMSQTLVDLYAAADDLFSPNEANEIKISMAKAVKHTNSKAEMLSALEDLIDAQPTATAKLQYDRVLEKMKSLDYSRDATKLRNREEERSRLQQEELDRLEAEKAKDGSNYGFDGYTVGDTVLIGKDGFSGVITEFTKTPSGENQMVVKHKMADGTYSSIRYNETDKGNIFKESKNKNLEEVSLESEKPVDKSETKEREIAEKQQNSDEDKSNSVLEKELVTEEVIGGHQESKSELKGTVDVVLDAEGAAYSPSAKEQGEAIGAAVVSVPSVDVTDQGNDVSNYDNIEGIISGNRFVEYSLEDLKNGKITIEVPNKSDSVFSELRKWLDNLGDKGTKLQEIIDEEFGRMISDNPDLKIQFMSIKKEKSKELNKILFNVVELTPEMRKKYHDDSRGGVIEANGKSWLIVGTTGFVKNATAEQRSAFDRMRGPINKRSKEYFQTNKDTIYYVDPVAHSKVYSTTSGRIVNQQRNSEERTLKKVSELLKSVGLSLNKAVFGIQTTQKGEKSFAILGNVEDGVKVFPPRNVQDNAGRVFILIDTANGNKIPAMIEPAMYSDLKEDSPLKEIITRTLLKLTDPSYEIRVDAIKQLCGLLVLDDNKNILIGKKGADIITIRRRGMEDITQKLGKDFDTLKFLNDIQNANFQVNITFDALKNPTMLKMYDESGALMTNVDSMRTAGMSYTIYMTDKEGNPITNVSPAESHLEASSTPVKVNKGFKVNNHTIEYRNGEFFNRDTGKTIKMGDPNYNNYLYAQAIEQGNLKPHLFKNNMQYFKFEELGRVFVVSRDSKGNVEFLNEEQSNAIINEINQIVKEEERKRALKDVDLGVNTKKVESSEVKEMSQEQLDRQLVGEFQDTIQSPSETQDKETISQSPTISPTSEVSSSSKQVISDTGTKSLEALQNTEKLSTFVDIISKSSIDLVNQIYSILEEKNWGVTGDFNKDALILKEHNVKIEGIDDINTWLEILKNCR